MKNFIRNLVEENDTRLLDRTAELFNSSPVNEYQKLITVERAYASSALDSIYNYDPSKKLPGTVFARVVWHGYNAIVSVSLGVPKQIVYLLSGGWRVPVAGVITTPCVNKDDILRAFKPYSSNIEIIE